MIQRDYSNGGFYDYYTHGGIAKDPSKENNQQPAQTGPESRTDSGRTVYGGGGITPDEIAQPARISPAESKLSNAIFGFAVELTSGRVAGFESQKVLRPIEFDHDLQASDFPITEALYAELRRFVAKKPNLKATPEQLDRSRAFVERQLRYDLATAAYGTMAAVQVYNNDDPQIARAVEVMPRARELAQSARRARARS